MERDGESVDAYGVRLALLDAVARDASLPTVDAWRLLGLALSDAPAGRELRAWLADPRGSLADALGPLLSDVGGSP